MPNGTAEPPSTVSLDRRIRSILAMIGGSSAPDALAALRALERVLPSGVTLADVLFIGLHHARQDRIDPSLIREIEALSGQLNEANRRIDHLEKNLHDAIMQLSKLRAGLRQRK